MVHIETHSSMNNISGECKFRDVVYHYEKKK